MHAVQQWAAFLLSKVGIVRNVTQKKVCKFVQKVCKFVQVMIFQTGLKAL